MTNMSRLFLTLLILGGANVLAEDYLEEIFPSYEAAPVMDDWSREPAAIPSTLNSKRNYPGGADEEDLRVQNYLPEAGLKTDARSVQREVYKALYNQELKDERHDPVEE